MKRDSEGVLAPGTFAKLPWGEEWTAEGVISLLEPMVVQPRRTRLLEVIHERIESVTLLMDAPHDPHNGAAILRSCDAFGIQTVHVVRREEEFLASSRVSKGSERWVDVIEHPNVDAAVATLTRAGFELVATHPKGELAPDDLAELPRFALVLGNEHDGISDALARAATRSVRIPMRGFVESLNVSVSAAVLTFLAARERRGELGEAERRLLYARGLYRTVSRAAEILAASAPG